MELYNITKINKKQVHYESKVRQFLKVYTIAGFLYELMRDSPYEIPLCGNFATGEII